MGKQELLDELNELLSIPQFERIVFHKVEELKLYLKDEVALYRDLKKSFKTSAYGDMQICGDTEDKVSQTYHFELNRNGKGEWIPTEVEPPPPPGRDIYDIIPEEIIEYISSFKTVSNKIETRRDFSFPTLKGEKFELRFAKYSDDHALGTVRCHRTGGENSDEKEEFDHIAEIYNYTEREIDDEGSYKELFYYMQKYPALKTYFFTDFHMKMKPLIVGNLVEITASSQPVDLF